MLNHFFKTALGFCWFPCGRQDQTANQYPRLLSWQAEDVQCARCHYHLRQERWLLCIPLRLGQKVLIPDFDVLITGMGVGQVRIHPDLTKNVNYYSHFVPFLSWGHGNQGYQEISLQPEFDLLHLHVHLQRFFTLETGEHVTYILWQRFPNFATPHWNKLGKRHSIKTILTSVQQPVVLNTQECH